MRWEADYNLLVPSAEGKIDLIGWVTIENQSDRNFEDRPRKADGR
jgi:hypothetical protein